VIEKIKSLNIPCILGNHDERIAFNLPVFPLLKHSEEETKARFIAIDHSKEHITEENKAFFRTSFSSEIKLQNRKQTLEYSIGTFQPGKQ
jgi:hypothetical protein